MAKTAGEMLEQKKIQLGANDTLSVAKDQAMIPGMTIELWRNGKQTVSEEKDVAFEVEKVKDMDRDVGYREIKTPGELGKRTVTYEIEMRDGKEVGRAEIQSILTKEPKKQVEVIGAKRSLPPGSHQDWMAAAGIAASDYGNVNLVITGESRWNPMAWGKRT
jgi:uncharacterized protein YabE (DUF348 family)